MMVLLATFSSTTSALAVDPARVSADDGGAFGRLPADFVGTIPCRNCLGTRYHLRLLPFEAFHLAITERHRGRDVTTYDIGSWQLSSDKRLLRLQGSEGARMFGVRDTARLRVIDTAGREIAMGAQHELRRTHRAPPFEPRLTMRGMYRRQANEGFFTECLTGHRLVVADEEAYEALEREYARQRKGAGEELMVSVEGRITTRPRRDGAGEQPGLVVERVGRFWPGETCSGRLVATGLEGTRWRLVRLGDDAVVAGTPQRQPWMSLDARTGRMSGLSGCNRMSGPFERHGETLRFGPIISTKMACPGVDFEDDVFRALEATRTWRVTGNKLDLMGGDGRTLARFESSTP